MVCPDVLQQALHSPALTPDVELSSLTVERDQRISLPIILNELSPPPYGHNSVYSMGDIFWLDPPQVANNLGLGVILNRILRFAVWSLALYD